MLTTLNPDLLILDARFDLRDIAFDKDNEQYRYKHNNRKLPDAELMRMLKRDAKKQADNVEFFTREMLTGKMPFTEWQKYMAETAKKQEIKYLRVGRGGKENTFAIHYLESGNQLRTVDYPALRKFAEDVTNGKLSEAQIIARARTYANHIPAYERGKLSRIKDKGGNILARRRLGTCANHCADCILLAQQGWLPINQVPPPGQACRCRANCCCSLETWSEASPPPLD
jgi:hypothetical protein